MKKKAIISISLLSILLFVSFANVSVAAPPAYVGVKEGDEFVWRASLNTATLNATGIALFGATNWTIMYEYFLEYMKNGTGLDFDFFAGAGMKAVMLDVSDETPHPYVPGLSGSGLIFDFYIAYAENNWTLATNGSQMGSPMIFLVNPDQLNESTIMSGISTMPLFMPIGFNYTAFIKVWNSMVVINPVLNGNVTLQVQGNGFKTTLKAAYLDYVYSMMSVPFEVGTLLDAVVTCRWDSNGVFDYGSIEYGGITLITAYLEGGSGDPNVTDEGLIPGFEIATIIGVSITTILAIIYVKRRKNT